MMFLGARRGNVDDNLHMSLTEVEWTGLVKDRKVVLLCFIHALSVGNFIEHVRCIHLHHIVSSTKRVLIKLICQYQQFGERERLKLLRA